MRIDKIFAITVLLVASTATVAASPADLSIFPKESSTEVNSFTSYEVEVENTGPVKDFYSLSSSSSEVRIAPREVELEPGQEETVNVWYNPSQDKEAGTYSFAVTATSRATDNRYSVEGIVDVIRDHEVNVAVSNSERTACLNEKVTYEVEVTNNGMQKEEFQLSTDFGKLSRNMVTLEDGETQTVKLTASAKRPVERNFNVVAASTTSYAQSITNLDFESVVCYSSDVSATPGQQEVAAMTPAEYEVTVRNTGTREDTFTLSTTRGELDDTELEVDGKSTESTTLTYTPDKLGKQSMRITAKGESEATTQVRTTAYNGMDQEVSFESDSRSACETESTTYDVQVENTGEAEETYSLSANRGELDDTELELEPGESEEVELTVSSENHKVGKTYNVKVTTTADTFGKPKKSATSEFTAANCWDLEMKVVPKVASAGENRSVIYEVRLRNTGTKENTYTVSQDGPSWISIKPEEVTVASGEQKTAYMYAGIPFEKEGEVKMTVTGEGDQVRKSQDVRLVIGEDIKDAIKSDRNMLTGSFSKLASDISQSVLDTSNVQKVLVSIVVGLAISLVVLYSEW
jgi:uncharacterized membrane protein